LHNNLINKVLNLKGVSVKKVIELSDSFDFYLETKPSLHKCPVCGRMTNQVHDYRI
jgi:transposase